MNYRPPDYQAEVLLPDHTAPYGCLTLCVALISHSFFFLSTQHYIDTKKIQMEK